MDTSVKGLNKWANVHSNLGFNALRIILGIFLIYKGGHFITNSGEFEDAIAPISNFMGGMFTFHYVAAAHIMGGIMILFGLLTRWAIIAQLPIFLGAVLVGFMGEMHTGNLILAIITLGVSLFFLLVGSGKYSADYYFKLHK